jgi:CCR4-NOT transcription complex subunit 2
MGLWWPYGRCAQFIIRAIKGKLRADNRGITVARASRLVVSPSQFCSVHIFLLKMSVDEPNLSVFPRVLNLDDPSEFPSLSGTPQAQQSSASQAIWGANPNARLNQHTPVQRPQAQAPQQSGQQAQQHDGQSQDDNSSTTTQSQFRSGGEDYRFGAQGSVGQISGAAQPQIGNTEDFPPLAGAAGELDRRSSILQNPQFSSGNASPFPNLGQSRNGLSSPSETQQERSLASAVGERTMPSASAG